MEDVAEQEPIDAQEQATFEAAFENARGQEPHAERPTSPETPSDPAPVATTPDPAPDPAPEPVADMAEEPALTPAQMKAQIEEIRQEMRQQLARQGDKAFGHIGAMQQALNELKAKSAAGQPVKLTADRLKRLNAEFPELAALLADDLNETLAGTPTGEAPTEAKPFDPTAVTQLVEERFTQQERAMEKKLLAYRHPDWETVSQSDAFGHWMHGLSAEAQDVLRNTWDSGVLSDAFDAFKQWRKQAEQHAAQAAASAATQLSSKTKTDKRLASALTPQGVPATNPPLPSEEDAFALGFKAVRGGA